jgi:hypothetical protein
MGKKGRFLWLALACALGVLLACGKKGGPSTARGNANAPTPPGLVAEFAMAHPESTWAAVRAELGADATLLPKSAALFVITTLGLPAALADELDLSSPIVGALDAKEQDFGVLAAVHVKSGAKVGHLLGAAGYGADGGGTVTAYRPPTAGPGYAVGTSGEYLVVASDARALLALAPYATTALANRAPAKSDISATIPGASLAGSVVPWLRRAWDDLRKQLEAADVAVRQKHGGSAPDFGDPIEALANTEPKLERLFTVVRDLSELRAELDVDPKEHVLRATVSLAAAARTGPAADELRAMAGGDAEPLLALPRSSVVAVLSRDGAEARAQYAREQTDAIAKVLGGRLGKPDQAKIAQAMQSWSEARGDWLAGSLIWSKTVRAAVLRASVSDPAKMDSVPGKMLDLLAIPAVADPLSTWIGDLHLSPATTSASVHTVHIVRRPPKLQTKKPRDMDADELDLRWSQEGGTIVGAVGQGAKLAHAALLPGSNEPKLADDPIISPLVQSFGSDVAFLLVLDTRRFASDAAVLDGAAIPAAAAYGKVKAARGVDEAWLRLQLPTQTLASLVRAALGARPR